MSSGQRISQVVLILIAGLGTFSGLRLSADHLLHGEVCPVIGQVPACNLVFLGYFAVVIAAFCFKKNWASIVFSVGWTPVFLLALSGVALELTKGDVCPPGIGGIPQCFFSFAMAVIAWIAFRVLRKSNNIWLNQIS